MISSQQSLRTFQCKVNWGWTGNFHGYKDGCAFPWWWRLIFMQRCPGDQERNAWLEHPRGAQRAGKWVALMTLKRLGTWISTNPEIPNTLCRSQVPLTVLDFFLSFFDLISHIKQLILWMHNRRNRPNLFISYFRFLWVHCPAPHFPCAFVFLLLLGKYLPLTFRGR